MGVRNFGLLFLFIIILELKVTYSNRIIFPDEIEEVKAKVGEKTQATKVSIIEQQVEVQDVPNRNMIIVPSNCPPGQQLDADGVCRDVF